MGDSDYLPFVFVIIIIMAYFPGWYLASSISVMDVPYHTRPVLSPSCSVPNLFHTVYLGRFYHTLLHNPVYKHNVLCSREYSRRNAPASLAQPALLSLRSGHQSAQLQLPRNGSRRPPLLHQAARSQGITWPLSVSDATPPLLSWCFIPEWDLTYSIHVC